MAASCAEDVALQYATSAAIASPSVSAFPAARAAGPNAAKTPAPIMDPSPIATASTVPSRRASREGVLVAFTSEIIVLARQRPSRGREAHEVLDGWRLAWGG